MPQKQKYLGNHRHATGIHSFLFIKKKDRRRIRSIFVGLNIAFVALLFLEFFFPDNRFLRLVELSFGFLFVVELGFQYLIAHQMHRKLLTLLFVLDVLSIVAIFLRFVVADNEFLHIFAAVRILRFYHTIDEFFEVNRRLLKHKNLIVSLVNLLVFIFVSTSIVFALQEKRNPDINTYVDALYYTVSTLTTTGFGDITTVGQDGKILTTIIMIFGVSIFFKIAMSIFRPRKVHYQCKHCGLMYHEADASHCKHCGQVVHIKNVGELE